MRKIITNNNTSLYIYIYITNNMTGNARFIVCWRPVDPIWLYVNTRSYPEKKLKNVIAFNKWYIADRFVA